MITRRDRPGRMLIALGAALLGSCGGGGGDDTVVAANLPPTVTLAAPANLATGLTGAVAVTATATDNVAVASVEFQVDGVALGVAVTAPPYATTLDASLYPLGQHVVRARATDTSGNVSPWSSALVQVGGARTQPSGFTRNEGWVAGLASAAAFAQAPDGRLFVAEQGGSLRVVKSGALLA